MTIETNDFFIIIKTDDENNFGVEVRTKIDYLLFDNVFFEYGQDLINFLAKFEAKQKRK